MKKALSLIITAALILTLAPAALAVDVRPAGDIPRFQVRTQALDLTVGEVSYKSTAVSGTTEDGTVINTTKTSDTTKDITDTAEGWAWYPNGTTVDGTAYKGKVLVLNGFSLSDAVDEKNHLTVGIPDGTTVVRVAGSTNGIEGNTVYAKGTVTFAGGGSLTVSGVFQCDNLSTGTGNTTTYSPTSVTVSGGDMFVTRNFYYTTKNNECTGSLNVSANLTVGDSSDTLLGYQGGFEIYGNGPITVSSGKFKNCGGALGGTGGITVLSGAVLDEGTGSDGRSDTVTVKSGGTWYVQGGSVQENIVIESGGSAIGGLAPCGTINGSFTCHGTMLLISMYNPTIVGTLTILGNLDISGATLTLPIKDNNLNKFVVGGTSTLTGATLHITGTPISGTKYNYLASQGGITGNLSTVDTAAQHFAPSVEGNNAYVTVSDIVPSEPTRQATSADVKQGQNSVEVSTRISDSTALVELSTGAQVKASSEALSVDASSLGSGVTAVEVGQKLVNCAAESGGLAVTLPNGNKVEFAKEAVQGAAQAASGEPLKLSLTTGNVADSSVRTALKGETPTAVFDLNISKGGEELHKFDGTVTATVSYSLPAGGQDAYDMLHLTGGLPMQVTAWSATTASVTWPTTSASPFVLVKKGSVQTEAPFTDVASNGWAYTGVKYCWYYGMVNGTSADTFSPVAALTREQLWTILARLDGQTLDGDVMAAARTRAVGIGITDGTQPEANISREQLAATLWRYAKYKNYDVSVGEDTNILSYDDANGISEYAVPAIQWACGAGVMVGSGNRLLPQGTATRAQAATMLMRFCQNEVK